MKAKLLKKGRIRNYSAFKDFRDNFSLFDEIIDETDIMTRSWNTQIIRAARATPKDLGQ